MGLRLELSTVPDAVVFDELGFELELEIELILTADPAIPPQF